MSQATWFQCYRLFRQKWTNNNNKCITHTQTTQENHTHTCTLNLYLAHQRVRMCMRARFSSVVCVFVVCMKERDNVFYDQLTLKTFLAHKILFTHPVVACSVFPKAAAVVDTPTTLVLTVHTPQTRSALWNHHHHPCLMEMPTPSKPYLPLCQISGHT